MTEIDTLITEFSAACKKLQNIDACKLPNYKAIIDRAYAIALSQAASPTGSYGKNLEDCLMRNLIGESCEAAIYYILSNLPSMKILEHNSTEDRSETSEREYWWDILYNDIKLEVKCIRNNRTYVDWPSMNPINTMIKHQKELSIAIFCNCSSDLIVSPIAIMKTANLSTYLKKSNFEGVYIDHRSAIKDQQFYTLSSKIC